jgi:cytochrome c551
MNKRKKAVMIGSLLALSFLVSVGCASQSASSGRNESISASSKQVTNGETNPQDMFRQTCAGCHGQNLEGYVGPNLQKIGNKLNEKQILEVITKGRGQMPGGLVTGEKAKSLAAWLASHK